MPDEAQRVVDEKTEALLARVIEDAARLDLRQSHETRRAADELRIALAKRARARREAVEVQL
jgi:hypothetical protein